MLPFLLNLPVAKLQPAKLLPAALAVRIKDSELAGLFSDEPPAVPRGNTFGRNTLRRRRT
jgi:hypothetical protein